MRNEVAEAASNIDAVTVLAAQLKNVYKERDTLLALIARFALKQGFPVGMTVDDSGEEGYKNMLFMDLPTGQTSWHIRDDELEMFTTFLGEYEPAWDGHTTDEKYDRIIKYAVSEDLWHGGEAG